MKRLSLLFSLLLALILPVQSWAAVAFVSDTDNTRSDDTPVAGPVWTSFAVTGTNPVIILLIAMNTNTNSVSSVVLSAGLSGTVQGGAAVKTLQVPSTVTRLELWCIAAPSGTGTITTNFSANTAYQSDAILMQGADQTTPCPTGDAGTANGVTNPLSVTPNNLTANDSAVGFGVNINAGDNPCWLVSTCPGTPDSRQTIYKNSTNTNMAGGYRLGANAVTVNWGIADAIDGMIAARIAAVATGSEVSQFYKRRIQ